MKILCAISHHGLGHLAQTAPVLNALGEARPDLEWLIWSGLSRGALESRLDIRFSHRHEVADVGLLMQDAVRVDIAASRQAYLSFHQHWDARVEKESAWLKQQGITGVLSNAAYLPLAAASQAGMAGVGFCSLNWRDIAHHYLHDVAEMASVFAQMGDAYQSARAFLALTPGLPMAWLANLEPMPPVAAPGRNRRNELNAGLGLPASRKLVLLGFGGVSYAPPAPLPVQTDVNWLVPDAWLNTQAHAGREDLIGFSQARMPFTDLFASCDALATKIGYGSFVEAAGLGLPVLYLDRPDWPETPWLVPWLRRHTRASDIAERALFSPLVGAALAGLWQSPVPPPPDISGATGISRRILGYLEI